MLLHPEDCTTCFAIWSPVIIVVFNSILSLTDLFIFVISYICMLYSVPPAAQEEREKKLYLVWRIQKSLWSCSVMYNVCRSTWTSSSLPLLGFLSLFINEYKQLYSFTHVHSFQSLQNGRCCCFFFHGMHSDCVWLHKLTESGSVMGFAY